MKITVYGHSDKVSAEELQYATRYMLPLLFDDYMDFKSIKKIDICFEKERNRLASVMPLNDKPDAFEIAIRPTMSYKKIISSLAHELVHVKQYVVGDLVSTHQTFWKGKLLSEDIEYWDLPHEIEAFGREPGLYHRYIYHIKSQGIRFNGLGK